MIDVTIKHFMCPTTESLIDVTIKHYMCPTTESLDRRHNKTFHVYYD